MNINDVQLYNADCLEKMHGIPTNSIDLICADIPYGTTACKWDNVIPFEKMWTELNRISKDTTPILLFGQQPFTSELIHSNIKNFKYVWYYKKLIASNFASAKYQPMKHIEEICVFTKSGKPQRIILFCKRGPKVVLPESMLAINIIPKPQMKQWVI